MGYPHTGFVKKNQKNTGFVLNCTSVDIFRRIVLCSRNKRNPYHIIFLISTHSTIINIKNYIKIMLPICEKHDYKPKNNNLWGCFTRRAYR